MTLTNEQKIANENYFLQMLEARTKLFLWKNQGECFDFSSGQIVPFTKKGYDAMEYHTRHGFCRQFLLPSKDNLTPMKTEFRCALCGNDTYSIPCPIGRFDYPNENTCKQCYDEYVVPCDKNPERHTPIYSPLGVGMTDGTQRKLLINERANYKVKLVCCATDTRPMEKLLNEYNDELEAVAKEEGFDITPNADLEMSDLIGGKIKKVVELIQKAPKLPKKIQLTAKNIAHFRGQLTELKNQRLPKTLPVPLKIDKEEEAKRRKDKYNADWERTYGYSPKTLSNEEFDKKFPNTDIDFLLKGLK